MRSVFFSPGSTQSLPCHTASGDNCTSSICPNTVVNYTCTITSGTPAVYTDWILSTGTCPSNTFPDMIRLLQFVSGQCVAVGLSMCGPFRASSILPSSGTNCLSSILTVSITAAMNGSTVMCNNTRSDASASTVVSMATINVVGMPFTCSLCKCLHFHYTYSLQLVQSCTCAVFNCLIAGSITSSQVVGISLMIYLACTLARVSVSIFLHI